MSKTSTALLLTALFLTSVPDALWAQAQQAAASSANRTETEILKTIVIITLEVKWPDKDGKPGQLGTVTGTGFVVSVPDSRVTDGRTFHYVVTNRHVAMAIEQDDKGHCSPLIIQKTFLTSNLKDPINGSRSDKEQIPLSQNLHWYF